jgi:hypothetical protein
MAVPSSGELTLGKIRQELEYSPPSPVRTYSFPSQEIQVPTESEKNLDGYFVCDIEFPSSTPSDGLIFETGGGGDGHWIGFRGGLLKARAGDGGVNSNTSTFNAAIGTTNSYPTDGQIHTLLWAWEINPGRIRVFIDGELKIDEFTTNNGPLSNNQMAGTNVGNYLANASNVTVGDTTISYSPSTASELSYYTGIPNINNFKSYSSGPFTTNSTSLQDAELGNISPLNTNSTSIPDGNSPHKISEWYGYDHDAQTPPTNNISFLRLDGVNDNISNNHVGTDVYPNLSNTDLTISFWYRANLQSKQNMYFLVSLLASDSWLSRPLIRMHYAANLNRLNFEVAQDSNNRARTEAVLHDDTSTTGISNFSTGWVSSQRGNTNSDGFTMITWTYDASNASLQLYWNDTPLSSGAFVNTTSTGFSSNIMNNDIFSVIGSTPVNNNNTGGDLDAIKFYNRKLSSSEISNLWNGGTIVDATTAGVTNNLTTEFNFEGNVSDSANAFNMNNNGGSILNY